jgi:hypothetical protein
MTVALQRDDQNRDEHHQSPAINAISRFAQHCQRLMYRLIV